MEQAEIDAAVRGVASAPLTYTWLAILFVTTRIQRSAGRRGAKQIQRTYSTNLRRLRREPSRVLAASLFWLDDRTMMRDLLGDYDSLPDTFTLADYDDATSGS